MSDSKHDQPPPSLPPTDCSPSEDYLKLFGDFGPTVNGDELKGWIRDPDGGVQKCYLNGQDCLAVAFQFSSAAEQIDKGISFIDEIVRWAEWVSHTEGTEVEASQRAIAVAHAILEANA